MTTIMRATCDHCGLECRDAPSEEVTVRRYEGKCWRCSLPVTWERWEVTERVMYRNPECGSLTFFAPGNEPKRGDRWKRVIKRHMRRVK